MRRVGNQPWDTAEKEKVRSGCGDLRRLRKGKYSDDIDFSAFDKAKEKRELENELKEVWEL